MGRKSSLTTACFLPGKSMPDAEIIVYAIKGKAFIAGACRL